MRKLIHIPTCYYKKHDLKPIITQLTKEFKKRGYKVQTFSTAGAPVVVADLDLGMKKTLLFYNHYDVQPEEPLSEWKAGWEGPGSKTVIGKEAMAKVDFRLVPNQKAEKIQKLLRRHLDKHGFSDVEMKLFEGYGSSRTAIDHPFIQLLANLAKDFSGQEPILIPSHQGSGPAYLFGTHTPWAMSDIFDPETNIHAPNESMRLRDFRHMTAFIAAVAIELGRN